MEGKEIAEGLRTLRVLGGEEALRLAARMCVLEDKMGTSWTSYAWYEKPADALHNLFLDHLRPLLIELDYLRYDDCGNLATVRE